MRDMENFSELCGMQDACALAGAAAFFAGIPDAAVVVNGPLWCYYYAMRHIEMNEPLISKRMLCTQLDNEAIVFGSEEYLRDTLEPYIEHPPAVLCIENNCSASLIGDDVQGIVRELGIRCPVVFFDSGGLIGGFAEGWQRASLALLEGIEPERAEAERTAVNLLGVTEGYYNGQSDTAELRRLLELAGYRVNACPGAGTGYEALSALPRAGLNIVVHRELGLPMAQQLEELCGTPFVAPLPPYGVNGTRQWMKEIHEALPAPSMERFEAECAGLEQRIFLRLSELRGIWDELWYDEVVISGTPCTAEGFARALRGEWADIGHMTLICPAGAETPSESSADEVLDAARDIERVKERLNTMKKGLVAASGNEAVQLVHFGDGSIMSFPIAYPVFGSVRLTDEPFMGLRGAAYVQETLWNAKIQETVRMKAGQT